GRGARVTTSPEPGPLGDFHSHLVPGVDDGSKVIEESMEALGRMVAAGFGRITTTPHIDASILVRDPAAAEAYLDRVSQAFETVVELASVRFPGLELRCGHEVRLDDPECDFTDPRLRIGGTSFAL